MDSAILTARRGVPAGGLASVYQYLDGRQRGAAIARPRCSVPLKAHPWLFLIGTAGHELPVRHVCWRACLPRSVLMPGGVSDLRGDGHRSESTSTSWQTAASSALACSCRRWGSGPGLMALRFAKPERRNSISVPMCPYMLALFLPGFLLIICNHRRSVP